MSLLVLLWKYDVLMVKTKQNNKQFPTGNMIIFVCHTQYFIFNLYICVYIYYLIVNIHNLNLPFGPFLKWAFQWQQVHSQWRAAIPTVS